MIEQAGTAVITPAAGPRIQLVGKDVAPEAFDRCFAALEKAGFAPTGQGPADTARPRAVVYAAKGFEADAKRIAAAVPGGASVEALSWKCKFDVVVALLHLLRSAPRRTRPAAPRHRRQPRGVRTRNGPGRPPERIAGARIAPGARGEAARIVAATSQPLRPAAPADGAGPRPSSSRPAPRARSSSGRR